MELAFEPTLAVAVLPIEDNDELNSISGHGDKRSIIPRQDECRGVIVTVNV